MLQPPKSEESIDRACNESALPTSDDEESDVEEEPETETETSGAKSATAKDESLTSQK